MKGELKLKKKTKKIISALCIVAMMVTTLPMSILDVEAANVKGTKITTNQSCIEKLSVKDEVDWYTFEITKEGYFQIEFGPKNVDDSTIEDGWKLTIYDENETKIKSVTDITTKSTLAKMPFRPGVYFVKVQAQSAFSNYAPVNCEYSLTVSEIANANWEKEYNENMSKANTIKPNTTYYGTTYCTDDVDFFKVNITETGYFAVEFSAENINSNKVKDGWTIIIYDADGEKLKTVSELVSKTTTPVLPFAKGTYYIKISPYSTFTSSSPVDCTYTFKVKSVKSTIWESEYNDKLGAADLINSDTTYYGTLYNVDDKDFFKVNIKKKGYFTVKVAPKDFTNNKVKDGWSFVVYDKNGTELEKVDNIKNSKSSIKLPFSTGTYYIEVKSYSNFTSSSPVDCTYTLRVNNTASSLWESENNEKTSTADKISLNTQNYYKGNLYKKEDKDVYKFTVNSKGKVNIRFKPEDASEVGSKTGWDVNLYDYSGRLIKKCGEHKKLKSTTLTLPKGSYYILVDAYEEWSQPVDLTYCIKVNHCGNTSISKITSKNKSATIKWNKVSNATGYKIYRATSKIGTYKLVKTVKGNSTTSYTQKGLTKGKNYYYKVQPYNTTNGVTTKADMSAIKGIKVK